MKELEKKEKWSDIENTILDFNDFMEMAGSSVRLKIDDSFSSGPVVVITVIDKFLNPDWLYFSEVFYSVLEAYFGKVEYNNIKTRFWK